MVKPDREPYLLFDLCGQNVGVLNAKLNDNGELQCEWVCIDKVRIYTNEQIEDLLHDAFKSLIQREAAKDKTKD